jgi:hypothetical protein
VTAPGPTSGPEVNIAKNFPKLIASMPAFIANIRPKRGAVTIGMLTGMYHKGGFIMQKNPSPCAYMRLI